MINEKSLQNTGTIRDLCHDICFELDELSSLEIFSEKEKKDLAEKYKQAKEIVEKITELGFFNKSFLPANKKEIISLIEQISSIENQANNYVKKVWAKQITNVEDFTQDNFCLCVKRLPNDLKLLEANIKQCFNDKPLFYEANLISNKNVFLNSSNVEEDLNTISFGVVYGVNENSFLMASDESTFCSLKQKDFETTNMKELVFGDLKVCIKGSAVKLKTPSRIIENNLKNPLFKNNNVVVLDSKNTKPVALFYCGYNIKKVNLLKRKLSFFAKKLNVPLINISLLKFYQNNKEYFTSNTISRKIFNNFVDSIAKDLNLYCKYDFKAGAKRLIGLNTNLRYNFLYKFSRNINSLIDGKDMDEADTADYIAEMFLKAIEKHNTLTKKREKANGAPLFFPDDSVFIALPKDFLKEE
ncbi:MAG: hypothetical protein IKA31_04590 [Clostridia bacterium]|nr:hypothetical protein [Clostridia bacterium]